MGDKTGIEWTDATWGPVTGCTKVSQGCKHCYAEREWPRLAAPRAQPNIYTGRAFTDVRCHPERLDQPLRWKRPRRIFVNSMSDLFHESVPDDFIFDVFAVMEMAKHHIFQVLTKRPERMLHLIGEPVNAGENSPPQNVWWGVSVEDQATADERIPLLLQTPAAVRWISAEPLLGPIDLADLTVNLPGNGVAQWDALRCDTEPGDCVPYGDATIDWVVVGGESGPNARPMHPDWARALRNQCLGADVRFLFKQWGEWAPGNDGPGGDLYERDRTKIESGMFTYADAWIPGGPNPFRQTMDRIGKKAAGRELDGVTWDQYPDVVVTEP